jgi:hypothetical protein
MGNYYFAAIRGRINPARVEATPAAANNSMFNGMLGIMTLAPGHWEISCQGQRLFNIGVEKGKVFSKNAHFMVGQWVQYRVLEYIGRELKAKMGDEGVEDRWDPEPDKYPTFDSYCRMRNPVMCADYPEIFARIKRDALEWLPQGLPNCGKEAR